MICVYDIGNENFDSNGNAVLQPTDSHVRMVAGGNYDMDMSHPMDPEGKWRHLVPGAVLKIPVPEEEIENAFAGYDADVYKTTGLAELREGPSEPTTISYPAWSAGDSYSVGAKVSFANKNYQCTYMDPSSAFIYLTPPTSSWWTEIPRTTSGSPVLVTLPAGEDLYFLEDVDSTWYKMSTYYGIEGYIRRNMVVYDRHLTPSETQPRIITEQLMRITNATADTKSRTVSITAQHVSYDLNGIIVKNVSLRQASPTMALGRITEGLMVEYPGTIATNLRNIEQTYSEDIKGKSGTYCLLDPDKGIVSQFDAMLKRDNWDIFVMKRTNTDRGFRVAYRRNMLGVNWTRRSDGLITRVVPVAKAEGGEDLFLPEQWVDSPLISNYPVIRMERLTVNGQVGKAKGAGDDTVWTESDLLDEMRTKAGERFTVDRADQIAEEITVDFQMLGDTEEYRELKGLEKVLLYDTVTAQNDDIGLDAQLTVTEMEWDPIRQRVLSIKISNVNDRGGRNVTGYNVQSKSIGPEKLTDDVADTIMNQVRGIIPEYADPEAGRPATNYNTLTSDGIVLAGQGNANKVWKTDGDGVPAWRDESGGGSGYIPTSEKGAAGGVATLDNGGKVPAAQLPSYVDDVVEYPSASSFPATGESGIIYVATDTNRTYRWSGSAYIELSNINVNDSDPTLAWGTRSKVGDVAGTDLHVTMPGNPVDGLTEDANDPTDSSYTVSVGSPSKKITFARVWNYIKGKISSVLGLTVTNYGGKAATAGTADSANSVAWGNITGKPGSFYTLPLAANGTRGGVQVGYTQSGKNYPVQLSGEKMYVNVPWENTTYNFSGTTFYSGDSVTGEDNCNNAVKNGNYYYRSNGPAQSIGATTDYGALYVQSYSDSWVGQIAQDYRNGRLFARGKNNGTWQPWKRIVQAEEAISSITRSGTTFTATRVDGTTFTFTQQDAFAGYYATGNVTAIIKDRISNGYHSGYIMCAPAVTGAPAADYWVIEFYQGVDVGNGVALEAYQYGASYAKYRGYLWKNSDSAPSWRSVVVGLQNNLTSTATDQALSAAQGKILFDSWTLKIINKTCHFTTGRCVATFSQTVYMVAAVPAGSYTKVAHSRIANFTKWSIETLYPNANYTGDINMDFYFFVGARDDSGVTVSISAT